MDCAFPLVLNVPAEQFLGITVLDSQYWPGGHVRQFEKCVAPGVDLYVPSGQSVPRLIPASQYWPAGHLAQSSTTEPPCVSL